MDACWHRKVLILDDLHATTRVVLISPTIFPLLVRAPWYQGLATVLMIALLVTRVTMQVLRG